MRDSTNLFFVLGTFWTARSEVLTVGVCTALSLRLGLEHCVELLVIHFVACEAVDLCNGTFWVPISMVWTNFKISHSVATFFFFGLGSYFGGLGHGRFLSPLLRPSISLGSLLYLVAGEKLEGTLCFWVWPRAGKGWPLASWVARRAGYLALMKLLFLWNCFWLTSLLPPEISASDLLAKVDLDFSRELDRGDFNLMPSLLLQDS